MIQRDISIGNDFVLQMQFKQIEQNSEFISRVEWYLQLIVLINKSSINGNGCDWGSTIMFNSLKSIHKFVFFPSFLYA